MCHLGVFGVAADEALCYSVRAPAISIVTNSALLYTLLNKSIGMNVYRGLPFKAVSSEQGGGSELTSSPAWSVPLVLRVPASARHWNLLVQHQVCCHLSYDDWGWSERIRSPQKIKLKDGKKTKNRLYRMRVWSWGLRTENCELIRWSTRQREEN